MGEVTAHGYRVGAVLTIHGRAHDLDALDALNAADRRALMGALDAQGLNAAFAGRLRFTPPEPPEAAIASLEAGERGGPGS